MKFYFLPANQQAVIRKFRQYFNALGHNYTVDQVAEFFTFNGDEDDETLMTHAKTIHDEIVADRNTLHTTPMPVPPPQRRDVMKATMEIMEFMMPDEKPVVQKPRKGMHLGVYRRGTYDCTAGGVSSKHDHVLVVGEGIPEVFEDRGDIPVLELVPGQQGGKQLHLRPIGETRWTMFGGNFAYTSDSRMNRINGGHPIPIFDRIEG